jgi:hypothetical protein
MTNSTSFSGMTLPEVEDPTLLSPGSSSSMDLTPPVDLTSEENFQFENLLTIGKLEKLVKIAGHSFHIRTINGDEEVQAGLIIKPFVGSDGYPRAYKIAILAACVEEIDGRPVYSPLGPQEDRLMMMRKKFDIWKEYYPVIQDLVYREITKLEEELNPLVEKLGKMSG